MKIRLLAVLALAATGAFAAEPRATRVPVAAPPATAPATLETLDTNGNGLINRHEAEANPQLKQRFGVYDKNRDRQIDRKEFAAFVKQ